MRGKFDSVLYATLDPDIEKTLLQEASYRDSIRRGAEFAEILLVLREAGGKMSLFKLKDELLAFGKDWRQSSQIIEEMVRIRALRRAGEDVELTAQLRENDNI